MIKFDCVHVDTCLPEYWSGHHLPHVQIAVWRGMTLLDIKQSVQSELNMGAIAGADADFLANWRDDYNEEKADKWHKRARAAVNRIRPAKPGTRRFFLDMEETDDDCCDSVYAFFIFVECEE